MAALMAMAVARAAAVATDVVRVKSMEIMAASAGVLARTAAVQMQRRWQ